MPKKLRKLKLPASFLYDAKNKTYGPAMTIALAAGLILLFSIMWALFISGPVRLHEVQQAKIEKTIEKAVPGIKGLDESIFEYVTWNGYTDDNLYWFDANGKEIDIRPIETLDYAKAKEEALNKYGIEAETITLAFGYNKPCYEIEGSNQMLMLDYDTLTKVYQRQVN